jgi:MoxR-like ATPase
MAVSSIKKKEKEPDKVRQKIAVLHQNIGLVIKGKPEAISLAIITLLARGHLLIEDAPGVGKTILAQSLAMSIHSAFQRIQFTSDLLPDRKSTRLNSSHPCS